MNKLLLLETNYKRNEFTFESSSLYNNNIQIEFLKRLPDGKRVIFNLHAIEGYSHPEIATLLEIQESTSILQLAKAKEMLQEMHLNYHNTVIIRA